MAELLTAAQMRAIEMAAIESGQVTGLELMERAGRGVVEAVFEEWPDLAKAPHKAIVLCGPGNNGGDGFVVARLLAEWGWEVEVFLYGEAEKLPPDAKANCERWAELGEVRPAEFQAICDHAPFDLRVDAVFGTGLRRAPSPDLSRAFEASRTLNWDRERYKAPRRVAVDCASCVDLDSGKPLASPKIWLGDIHLDYFAELTVTFHRRKIGHAIRGDWDFHRKIKVCDIGLEDSRRPRAGVKPPPAVGGCPTASDGVVTLIDAPDPNLSNLSKFSNEHKYSHGHALILSGGSGRTGAARLAARGALRIGAGLVTLGVPGAAQMEVACQITALMLRRVDDGAGLAEVLEDARLKALCLGPGMGVERARELVPVAVRAQHTPCVVLDADALTAFQDDPHRLFALLHDKCVLTPHGGEFARLFPDIADKLNAAPMKGPAYSKVDATREAAERADCVVLFKGPDTVIAAPDGRCVINSAHYDRAAPWLATAGSGDVLAGFITGLLARGFAPMQAAQTAAWLHVETALSFGPGLIAEDLPEELPKVFGRSGN